MSKITIKTLLKKENKKTEKIYQAIKQDHKIIYHDDICQVTIHLTEPYKMIRENDEFRLEMYFLEGKETQNPYLLKQGNGHLKLDMYTYYCKYNDNKLMIKYQFIGSDTIEFEMEEISK